MKRILSAFGNIETIKKRDRHCLPYLEKLIRTETSRSKNGLDLIVNKRKMMPQSGEISPSSLEKRFECDILAILENLNHLNFLKKLDNIYLFYGLHIIYIHSNVKIPMNSYF